MKRFGCLAIGLLAMTLTGCSTKTPGEFFSGYTPKDTTQQISDCRAWIKQKQADDRAMYEKLDKRDMAFVLLNRDTMEAFKDIHGKGKDVCAPGSAESDMYIAYVTEENKTKRVYAQETGSTARLGIGVTGGVIALDKLAGMAGDRVGGDQVNAGRDVAKTDSGGDVTSAGTNTDSNNVERINQVQASSDSSPNSITKTTPTPAATEELSAETELATEIAPIQ